MRPRHEASEIGAEFDFCFAALVASMRPRHEASEIVGVIDADYRGEVLQ